VQPHFLIFCCRKIETATTDYFITILENLRHKHDILCRLCVTLNKVYSIPLLLTTLQNFVIIIVTCFLHVEDSKPLKDGHSRLMFNVFDGIVVVLNCTEMVVMAKICSKTRNEVSTWKVQNRQH
jgi:hypothetical protein